MSLSQLERETVITMNDEDNYVVVYTCQAPKIRKLDRLCADFPEQYKLIKKTETDSTYHIPKKAISINAPRAKRDLTDEQREAMANRMRNLVKKQD